MRQLQRRAEQNPSVFGDLLRRLRVFAGASEDEEGGIRLRIERLIRGDGEDSGPALVPAVGELVLNALAFGELQVADVMVQRPDIKAVPKDATLAKVLETMQAGMHTRLPVFGTALDDIVGMVHVKDLLPFVLAPADPFDLATITRRVLVVPPSMSVLALVREMRDTRVHMAVVVDEFGGTDGLVTMEDLVGEIIGEIPDEHDPATDAQIVRQADGSIDVDGRVYLDDLEDELGVELVDEETREDVETVSGLLTAMIDRIPMAGESIPHAAGFVFEILDASTRRIERVKIHDRRQSEPGVDEVAGD